MQAQRPLRDADGADMSVAGLAVFVLIVKDCRRGKSKVAAAPGEFQKSPSPASGPSREPHLPNDLVGGHRGHRPTAKKVCPLDHSPPELSHHGNFRLTLSTMPPQFAP